MAVFIYALLNFFPYLLLAIFPFKDKLRFSKMTTLCFILGVTGLEVLIEYLVSGPFDIFAQYFTWASTILCVVSFFVIIREHIGKLVFTLLIVNNIANFIAVASAFFSYLCFSDVLRGSHIAESICMFILQLFILVPCSYYVKRYYAPVIDYGVANIWRFLWIIPLIFYAFWCYILYFATDLASYEIAIRPRTSLFLFLTMLGSWMIYHFIILLIKTQHDLLLEEQTSNILKLQTMQYDDLTDRIMKAKIARHDVRHHITLLHNLLHEGRYDELHDYLASYEKSLSLDTTISFCKHQHANLIIGHFACQAKHQNIAFYPTISILETCFVDDLTLSVILGNLLENAIDGCCEATCLNKSISLTIKATNEIFLLSIENSACCSLDKNRKVMVTTKPNGSGLGLLSVKQLVRDYQGTMKIDKQDTSFIVQIVLYPKHTVSNT